ncbi:MAG: right-handed parallel beta-helix repeat-containing protein [Myxococcaceae bacterium]|nr:right-handed parallel beta-helix repeat-containing protein [Myxococcaceae bacterium]
MFRASLTTALLTLPLQVFAADLYVSAARGDNGAAGTKEAPFKDLDVAASKAKPGDTLHVAAGNYFGVRGKGYIELKEPVTLLGGYDDAFSKRDVLGQPTLIQPTNESAGKSRKPLLTLTSSKKGNLLKVDGFIFDAGARNSYHKAEGKPEGVETGLMLIPPEKSGEDAPTVTEPCLTVETAASAGDVELVNNVFVNCANFAVQAGHKQGTFKIVNNVFVANRMAAIEVYGTGGKKGPKGPTEKDGEVEVANNTILFTWSRVKDFQDMGYGVRVMTNLGYDIHHNIIGGSVFSAVDHTRFNKGEWVKLDKNVFFGSKQSDLTFSEAGNVQLERVKVKDFGDLGLASAQGNQELIPKLPIDKAYLEGYLSASYSEKADYDPNSAANQFREAMGLNKQGKLTTKVSMFANRYPWKEALKLFGAHPEFGAQSPK